MYRGSEALRTGGSHRPERAVCLESREWPYFYLEVELLPGH